MTYLAGDILTADDANSFARLLMARSSSNQSLTTSSTTLQDVTGLSVSVAASTVYAVEIVMFHDNTAGTTEDVAYGFVFPSGAALRLMALGGTAGGVAGGTTTDVNVQLRDFTSGTTTHAFGCSTTATGAVLRGILVVSSTAGTFKVQAAQNTSGSNTTRVLANSYILLTSVG